jgi:hypothetical protein
MVHLLLVIAFWKSPITVRCHMLNGQDICFVYSRDKREHTIKSYGLPASGIKWTGGSPIHEWSYTVPSSNAAAIAAGADPVKIASLQPPVPVLYHVEVDGKIIKVKR